MPEYQKNSANQEPNRQERLFIALSPPEEVRGRLASFMAEANSFGPDPSLKWASARQLHLTLRFLGSVEARRIEAIQNSLRAVCFHSFYLRFNGLGYFEKKRESVLWAASEVSEALLALKAAIDEALLKCGIPKPADPYRPHLTLARNKKGSRFFADLIERGPQMDFSFPAHGFVLFKSERLPQGARHSALELFQLADDPFQEPEA